MSNHTKTAAAYTQRAQLLRQIAQGPSEKMAEALLVLAEEFEHMAGVLAAKSSEVPAPNAAASAWTSGGSWR